MYVVKCQGVILQLKNGQCDPMLAFSYTHTSKVDAKLARGDYCCSFYYRHPFI